MAKIWIIGANGMLGSSMRQILSIDHEVISTGREIDITNTFLVIKYAEKIKPDYIVNCSSFNNVDGAEEEYRDIALNVNANGPMNIAIAARLVNAEVLHFSTDYVFDGSKLSYNEFDLPNAINWYGKTKHYGENKFCSISSNCFIIRTSWLFAGHGNNFVKTMVRLFNEQNEVQVVDDQIGCPTYVPYLANISSKLLLDKTKPCGIWHIVNSEKISWYGFAIEIYKQSKKLNLVKNNVKIIPITSEKSNRKAIRPKFSVLNTNRVENYFGEPMASWRQFLYDCLCELKGKL